jgi:hypothetical protein
MTDRRTLVFTDEEFARDAGDAITFWGQDGDTRVRCRISRESLDDHFSDGDRLKPEAAFKKHRKEIEVLARRKYLYGEREPSSLAYARRRVGCHGDDPAFSHRHDKPDPSGRLHARPAQCAVHVGRVPGGRARRHVELVGAPGTIRLAAGSDYLRLLRRRTVTFLIRRPTLKAPQYERADMLRACINRAAYELSDPIDRIEVLSNKVVVSAGTEQGRFDCTLRQQHRPRRRCRAWLGSMGGRCWLERSVSAQDQTRATEPRVWKRRHAVDKTRAKSIYESENLRPLRPGQ